MDKLKNNLTSIAALIAAIIAIGGGFAKFGEMQTKLDALSNPKGVLQTKLNALENAKGVDISGLEITVQGLEKDIAIIQTENKLFKVMLEEIKAESNNPLAN
jgi:hypothetical protein|tara:strand:+ start:74 stop:379 length:306 start_codon:yes stop_codon:yes gene_type:complete